MAEAMLTDEQAKMIREHYANAAEIAIDLANRFMQAAAAAEREQCAKTCEEMCGRYPLASENTDMYVAQDHMLRRAAAAIRNRKEPA